MCHFFIFLFPLSQVHLRGEQGLDLTTAKSDDIIAAAAASSSFVFALQVVNKKTECLLAWLVALGRNRLLFPIPPPNPREEKDPLNHRKKRSSDLPL